MNKHEHLKDLFQQFVDDWNNLYGKYFFIPLVKSCNATLERFESGLNVYFGDDDKSRLASKQNQNGDTNDDSIGKLVEDLEDESFDSLLDEIDDASQTPRRNDNEKHKAQQKQNKKKATRTATERVNAAKKIMIDLVSINRMPDSLFDYDTQDLAVFVKVIENGRFSKYCLNILKDSFTGASLAEKDLTFYTDTLEMASNDAKILFEIVEGLTTDYHDVSSEPAQTINNNNDKKEEENIDESVMLPFVVLILV